MVSAVESLVRLAGRVQSGRVSGDELETALDTFENTLAGAQAAASPIKLSLRPSAAAPAPAAAVVAPAAATGVELGLNTHAVRVLAELYARVISFHPAPLLRLVC